MRLGVPVQQSKQLTGGKRPRVVKQRANAFTAAKQAKFLDLLAGTCNVAMSCRETPVADSTVRRHYEINAAFRGGWDQAIAHAVRRLNLHQLDLALNGTTKTVTKADGSVDRTHEYPVAMAMQLLRLHWDKAAAAAEPEPEELDREALEAMILRRIERLSAGSAERE